MRSSSTAGRSVRFKVGSGILIVLPILLIINYLGLMIVRPDKLIYVGFATLNLYALAVLLGPFRRGERWAWGTTWLLPLALGVGALVDPRITIPYAILAILCALGLLLTASEFRPSRSA